MKRTRHEKEVRHIPVRRAEHESVEPVPAPRPLFSDALHVHGEDVVRHVARMHEGHHPPIGQEVIKTQMTVAAGQCFAARADDQPADAVGHAVQVHRFHERQLDQRVGA
jgi:hypothetical protein